MILLHILTFAAAVSLLNSVVIASLAELLALPPCVRVGCVGLSASRRASCTLLAMPVARQNGLALTV